MKQQNTIVVDWTADEMDAMGQALDRADLPMWADAAAYGLVPGNGGLHADRAEELYRVVSEVDIHTLDKGLRRDFVTAMQKFEEEVDL